MSILRIKDKDGKWQSIVAIRGEIGPQGKQGEQGLRGVQGEMGLPGPKGDPGLDGKTPEKYVDYFTNDDINELNLKYIQKYLLLFAVSDIAPAEGFNPGDKYYNIIDKLIYTAIDDEHWSDSSEEPISNVFYIDTSNNELYYWNGSTLVSCFEKILNELITKSNELSYELVTDGPAVKTGRKVDGKNEYVKRISTSISNGTNKRVDLGLPLNAIIRDYTGMISEGISSGAKVRDGFFLSTTNFFSMHVAGIQMQIITGTTSDWITSTMRCYIDVFFTLNEEQQSEEVAE